MSDDKLLRLIQYLQKLARLKMKPVYDYRKYEHNLFLGDIPIEPECWTLAREREARECEDYSEWIKISKPHKPDFPPPPDLCEGWFDDERLQNPDHSPELTLLEPEVSLKESSAQSGFMSAEVSIERQNCPDDVRDFWEKYIKTEWSEWAEKYRKWKAVQDIYNKFFDIHQDIVRLGDDYEFVLGLGLLHWRPQEGSEICRHIIVADASLTLDSQNESFTVGIRAGGANLRLELDMLSGAGIAEGLETSAGKYLREAEDDPFNRDHIDRAIKDILSRLASESEYSRDGMSRTTITRHPHITWAPTLFLRKRSAWGLIRVLESMEEQVGEESGNADLPEVPLGFLDIAEMHDPHTHEIWEEGEYEADLPQEIYFPKPSNESQRKILDRLNRNYGVLVQGPPGTGKSHTIANLICHLLATGQNILVTAKTARALAVLKNLLPEEVQPLCVTMLGDGYEERASLEESVKRILHEMDDWDLKRKEAEIRKKEQQLDELRREKAKREKLLRNSREAETDNGHQVAGGVYLGTAMNIVKQIDKDKEHFEWFTDSPREEDVCPIMPGDFRQGLALLREITREESREAQHDFPANLLPVVDMSKLMNDPDKWKRRVVQDVMQDNVDQWRRRLGQIRRKLHQIQPHLAEAVKYDAIFPETASRALHDIRRLKGYAEGGGLLALGSIKIKWLLPKELRDAFYVLSKVRINGQACDTLFLLGQAERIIGVHHSLDEIWSSLRLRPKKKGSLDRQFELLLSLCDYLEKAIILGNTYVVLSDMAIEPDAHPVIGELLKALQRSDVKGYAQAMRRLSDLESLCERVQKRDIFLEKLREYTPEMAESIEANADDPVWDERAGILHEAWNWKRANNWCKRHLGEQKDDTIISRSIRDLENRISETMQELVALKAWSFCNNRLNSDSRRHLLAWQQAMGRVGKGTGKHANRHRKEAQKHLKECLGAVPAWVMPLHRVWDTANPRPGMFDIVIIDEASQCGFEGVPLFYLAKKLIIVGDDKQISPDHVGVDQGEAARHQKEMLGDFEHGSSLDITRSLFDQGRMRYNQGCVTLKEHFRCMPEIIRFSNRLCYNNSLIPLRQYGADRLPPLMRRYVEEGYREGKGNGIINRPEAEALARKIERLCQSPSYEGKTMGVVVLQGEAQAKLIEGHLRDSLGISEMNLRKLICGNPYNFQGDERDIIFLSMVTASNEPFRALTSEGDQRRFNVAVSRAKDQIWLFHSVGENDLRNTDCMRRKLLDHFKNPHVSEVGGINREELERLAHQAGRNLEEPPRPYDSWFEVDVALKIARMGYQVIAQHEVAGKRIDLVVRGGGRQLAVECDGDRYHGPEHYEDDMARQGMLERCGWEFFRVRGSVFYANPDRALEKLWEILREREIYPEGTSMRQN